MAEPTITSLAEQLHDLEVIVCCGSGGVGKTTAAAALALRIATEYDKKVLVLTVDPARRLATALGLSEGLGQDPVSISGARLRRIGISPRGQLDAAMLDAKTAWDHMVQRYAASPEAARRIMKNRFYQSISDAFVGSHEYVAMEALYELHAAGEYDCVVIDTPPSRTALDFLQAPSRITDFVGGKLLSWIAGGSRFGFRALNFAATPFTKFVTKLLGTDVFEELGEFVRDVQQMYGGIQGRARDVYRLLRSPAVGFVVVTTLEDAAFGEAEYFCSKLREFSMPLRGVVVNRTLPSYFADPTAATAARTMAEDERLPRWLHDHLEIQTDHAMLAAPGEEFLTYHHLAARQQERVRSLGKLGNVPLAHVPLIVDDVSDLEGLARIAASL